MSSQSPFGGRVQRMYPVLPRGEVVETFETYAEAQNAVAVLARAEFPVKKLAIVGNELHTVERVTGRMSYGRSALGGAASGAWLGIFFGLLMLIFLGNSISVSVLVAAILIGAGFGMLFSLATYSLNRRRRDYTSTMQVIAGSYALMVDPDLVNRARNLLANDGAAGDGIVQPVQQQPEPTTTPVEPGDEQS